MTGTDDPRADADAWRARREAAVAAGRGVVGEFSEQLRVAFASAPSLEGIWLEHLAGRIADLLLRRRLYAFEPETPGSASFFVLADGAPAAEAAVAKALRVGRRSTSDAGSSFPDGYTLTVVDTGVVVASLSQR